MNCEQVTEQLLDRIEGLLDRTTLAEVDRHLASCATCRREAEEIEGTWTMLGEFDEEQVSETMRVRFFDMLAAYREGAEQPVARNRFTTWLEGWWPRQPALQAGLALATLILGLWLGPRLGPGPRDSGEIDELRAEMQSMSRVMTVSMLQHQSATERLRAVGLSQQSDPDSDVTRALLGAIDNDPSVNVRLAALHVLSQWVQRPEVRRGLLQTFPRQKTPTMQVAIAEVLAAMNGPRSQAAIEEFLEQPELSPAVREHLQQALQGGGEKI